MSMQNRRTVQLALDGGGPICAWREEAPGTLHRRLLITTRFCDNPACDCRDVWVDGMLLDDRYEQATYINHTLRYTFRPGRGEPSEPVPLRRLSAAVDIDSGEVSFNPHAPAALHDEEMLGWLREGLHDDLMTILRKRWRLGKGLDQDRWRRRDWSWWQPGRMISWVEVFPDEPNIVFSLKNDTYWMDDMYCINPGCKCTEAGLYFSRITTGQIEAIGAISVTLPSGRFSDFMDERGNGSILKRLCSEARKRPGIKDLLIDRKKRIKTIGPEIVRLSSGCKEAAREPSRGKAGRNDPCPCGSGKKFKKCCGG